MDTVDHVVLGADAVEETLRWCRAQEAPSSATDHSRTQPVAPGAGSNR